MSGTLYSLSLGGSMEVPFLEDAKKRSWRETLILVPNRYYKRRIGQRGIASVDSIDKLPRMILRYNNLNDSVQSIRVPAQKRLLEDVLEYFKGRLIYFETLEDRNGFRENLLSLFNEFTWNRPNLYGFCPNGTGRDPSMKRIWNWLPCTRAIAR